MKTCDIKKNIAEDSVNATIKLFGLSQVHNLDYPAVHYKCNTDMKWNDESIALDFKVRCDQYNKHIDFYELASLKHCKERFATHPNIRERREKFNVNNINIKIIENHYFDEDIKKYYDRNNEYCFEKKSGEKYIRNYNEYSSLKEKVSDDDIELFNYIFVFDDIALVIVKDNSFSAVLLESKSATRKACGAVLFFIGEAGTRADDDGAGLTLVVGGAALIVDIGVMLVSAEHKVGLYFLAEKASPLRVGVLLDIKGRLVCVGKYKVTNYKLMLNALCLIFVLCVFDNTLNKLGFCKSELMEAYRYAILGVTVYLVLTAIENKSPNRAYAEGVICLSVNGRNEVRHILCVNTSCIVITS
mgnify:CR=1 FL=1